MAGFFAMRQHGQSRYTFPALIAGVFVASMLGRVLAQDVQLKALVQGDRTIPPLTLRSRIALPGVYGRMDHYGWDTKRGILLVTALGNNTVEIVDQWKRVRSLEGLEHPQASIYLPSVDRIAVSNQSGKLRFYDAANYTIIKTIDLGANADNMRYDANTRLLFVGAGEGANGRLVAIDPTSMEPVHDFALGSHPESFQIAKSSGKIFVNLPDQEAIKTIDRTSGEIATWKIPGNSNSHALAFDETRKRLFTAALQPGRFTAIDAENGQTVAALPCVLGVDDI
jgi:DNA-binding beta-propeller fold protein YncE